MPILDYVNDDPSLAQAGLPVIGKLHKGGKKIEKTNPKTGEKYEVVGPDLDYFRIEFEEEFKHLEPIWVELYGDKPKKFKNVKINVPSTLQALDFWNEEWSQTTLMHRCDGKMQAVSFDKETGRYRKSPILCQAQICQCKPTGRLNFLFPDFIRKTGYLGYITALTTSEEDIRTLFKRLTAYEKTYGTLKGIPFIFYREKRRTSAPEVFAKGERKGERTGKRIRVRKSLLDIQVDPDFMLKSLDAITAVQSPMLLSGSESNPALPAEVTVADAREALSSGPRRLGSDAPPAVPEQPPAPQPQETALWWTETPRWQNFVSTWGGHYKLDQEKVLQALDNASIDVEIRAPQDWKWDEIAAMAAVVAYALDYDVEAIQKAEISLKSETNRNSVRNAAISIAQSMQDEGDESGESDIEEAEIEDIPSGE